MELLCRVYDFLLESYGEQGWWPLGRGAGYHPGDYGEPRTRGRIFEVYLGAILTQNSSWSGARTALANLRRLKAVDPRRLLALPEGELEEAIRPARYLRQKARYAREIAGFFLGLRGRVPGREELLGVTGVGRETADSILLYAHHEAHFVIDAYTRRVLAGLRLAGGDEEYDFLKEYFEKRIPRDAALYNEYHALIVEHARRFYSRKPYGAEDPLPGLVRRWKAGRKK